MKSTIIKKKLSKGIDKYIFLFSFTVSLNTVLMTRVHFSNDVWGTIQDNYIKTFNYSALILFFLCLLVSYSLISKLDIWIKNKHYGWNSGCLFAPQLCGGLTLMIATPIAVSSG